MNDYTPPSLPRRRQGTLGALHMFCGRSLAEQRLFFDMQRNELACRTGVSAPGFPDF
jgi:hypothetical protein